MSKGFANCRVVLLASMVFVSFVGLGTRLVWLQVLHRDQLLDSVDKARREIIVQSARRGDIMDVGGNLLATSRSVIKVGVDPRSLRPQDEKNWPQLAELLGRPLPEIAKILTTRFRPAAAPARPPEGVGMADRASGAGPMSLVFNLPGQPAAAPPAPAAAAQADEADAGDDTQVDDPDVRGDRPIKYAKLAEGVSEAAYQKIRQLGIQGIVGDRVYQRDYPDNELAAHVLGYVNHDEKPVTGIEAYADFYLRGQDGWVETERDGRRQELPQFRTRVVPPSDGYSVKLSIDSYVQHVAEQELALLAAKFLPIKATIIISDPRTGFILALANYPTFNLNQYNRLPKDRVGVLRNIAATDQYEPGSVFKIVAVSGALNEGLVTPQTTFDCNLDKILYTGAAPDNRGVVLDRTLVRELPPDDDHFNRRITVAEIVSHSSNRGADQLAMMLKDQKFYAYARAFGFGERTGFPVGGGQEIVGNLKPVDKWDSTTITRMPMGQGVDATALQMHQAMGVIASGGVLLRPQVIREIRDPSGNLVYAPFRRSEVRRVVKESTARTMADLLTHVVSDKGATGELAQIPGYEVAGKTGTTQKLLPIALASGKVVMHYSASHHVASFVGFLPARNPQIEISVFVDDPDAHTPGGIGFGGKVSAPAFKDIALQLIPYLQIHPAYAPPDHTILAMGGSRP